MRQNVLHCVGCCLCVFYIGYDQSLLSALQVGVLLTSWHAPEQAQKLTPESIPQWNEFHNNPSGMWLGLIAASLFFPALFTVFISSWISQRYGRRPAIWVGAILIIAGALLNGLAANTGQFIGGRALLGAGGAMTKVSSPRRNVATSASHRRLSLRSDPCMSADYPRFVLRPCSTKSHIHASVSVLHRRTMDGTLSVRRLRRGFRVSMDDRHELTYCRWHLHQGRLGMAPPVYFPGRRSFPGLDYYIPRPRVSSCKSNCVLHATGIPARTC